VLVSHKLSRVLYKTVRMARLSDRSIISPSSRLALLRFEVQGRASVDGGLGTPLGIGRVTPLILKRESWAKRAASIAQAGKPELPWIAVR
jgi:hypothetical protein